MKWKDLFEREKENIDFVGIGRKKSVFQMLSIFAYAESLEFSYLFHNEQFAKLSLLSSKFTDKEIQDSHIFFDAFLTSSGCLLG